jgi:hypothetical protein
VPSLNIFRLIICINLTICINVSPLWRVVHGRPPYRQENSRCKIFIISDFFITVTICKDILWLSTVPHGHKLYTANNSQCPSRWVQSSSDAKTKTVIKFWRWRLWQQEIEKRLWWSLRWGLTESAFGESLESGGRLFCWCVWRESGFSLREDVFTSEFSF